MARAGTGKTSTIVEGARHLPRGRKTLFTAFNKSVQREIDSKVRGGVEVKTLHSLGLSYLKKGSEFANATIDSNKSREIAKDVALDLGLPKGRETTSKLMKLAGLAKNCLAEDDQELENLIVDFDLDDSEDYPAAKLIQAGRLMLERSANEFGRIDFDDMIWLPAHLKLSGASHDFVIIDEVQDMTAAQYWLATNTCRPEGRIIAVGDDKQAIYGWRGAQEGLMAQMAHDLKATKLPLSITYRCPREVVRIVKPLVPDFEAAPHAIEGEIKSCTVENVAELAQPGDFVLSRTNAPLMGVCIELLQRNVPTSIAGKDIGRSLVDLAEKSKARTVDGLRAWCKEHLQAEWDRMTELQREERYERLQDRVEALLAVCQGMSSVPAVIAKIETMFHDDDPTATVVCSTVHKAKGLERDRVFILADTMRPSRGPADRNIYYVALTRARKQLWLARNA